MARPPANRRIILHLGPHKTGTTALQSFFSENRGLLQAHGLYYPVAGCVYGGHHNLAWEILVDARFVRSCGGWTQLLEELNRLPLGGPVMLSSEDFSLIPIARLSQFFYALAGMDITVVWIYRPLGDFLESLHAEEVKNGMTLLSLEQFVTEKIAFDQRVHLDKYFSLLTGAFGVRVAVLPYRQDVVTDVAAYLDLPPMAEGRHYRENARIAKGDLRRLLAHRRRHGHLDWYSYFHQYAAPRLRGTVPLEGEMAPEEDFILPEHLIRMLAAQDQRNIAFFLSQERIDYLH